MDNKKFGSNDILNSELSKSTRKFAFALLLSGFAALCYQVAWQKGFLHR